MFLITRSRDCIPLPCVAPWQPRAVWVARLAKNCRWQSGSQLDPGPQPLRQGSEQNAQEPAGQVSLFTRTPTRLCRTRGGSISKGWLLYGHQPTGCEALPIRRGVANRTLSRLFIPTSGKPMAVNLASWHLFKTKNTRHPVRGPAIFPPSVRAGLRARNHCPEMGSAEGCEDQT